jgi:hypothetical protein
MIAEGLLSFRGQTREHRFKRKIPNPVRSDEHGFELSIMPGAYRSGEYYSFRTPPVETKSITSYLRELEPNTTFETTDGAFSSDMMRTEQHYAHQTRGLDLTFEVRTAVFFATHRFVRDPTSMVYVETIPTGSHTGVIYCFRFRDPPVQQTQYLIRGFDYFKTYPPERILRQKCGLPLVLDEERNIAITDIDCIIELTPDFSDDTGLTPEFMFPSAAEDLFYGKLLALKDNHPADLSHIDEYRWARPSV